MPLPDLPPLPSGTTLLDVYSDFLKYLVRHTSERLIELTGESLWSQNAEEVEIVLTHPNMWGPEQREFLLEAVIKSQLISRERASQSVHFVPEAEAAARYSVSRYSTVFGRLQVDTARLDCFELLVPYR